MPGCMGVVTVRLYHDLEDEGSGAGGETTYFFPPVRNRGVGECGSLRTPGGKQMLLILKSFKYLFLKRCWELVERFLYNELPWNF